MGLLSLAAGSWWYEIWISLWLLICQGIYIFIGALYQVFEKVASVNLFSMEVFEEITGRIYVIMGIAMLFIFAYNLVLLIINPDDKKGSNNQMGKVVKETIISLVLLVLLPVIFNYLYIFQTHVLESNVIGQVILGDVGTTQGDYSKCDADDNECKCDFSEFTELENYNNKIKIFFGLISFDYDSNKVAQLTSACKKYREDLTPSQRGAYSISPTILSAFYRPTNFNYTDCASYLKTKSSSVITTDEEKQICVNFYFDVNYSKYTGNVAAFSNDSYLKDIISDPKKDSMEFHWLMATVAGVLAVYMFFCYAMEIGVRVAKLGFLQLISPIPVMMRIIPGQKEKIFDKWLTHLKNTYLDVFIRLLIIYFCLFAISLVPDVMDTLWASTWSGDGNFFVKMLAMVFVILGILKFAGDAPALFKEFFGGSGQFALRSPKKQLGENKLAMGGLGMASGALMGAYGNYYKSTHDEKGRKIQGSGGKGALSAVGGLFGGARRGAVHGAKAKDWDSFKSEMHVAKSKNDLARSKRLDRIKAGDKVLGENVPIISGLVGAGVGIGDNYDNFVKYMQKDHAGATRSAQASSLYKTVKDGKAGFSSGRITDVERLRNETNTALNKGEDINFLDGRIFRQDKTNGRWVGNDGSSYTTKEMDETVIKDYIKSVERDRYVEEYLKDRERVDKTNSKIFKELTDSLSGLGSQFSENLTSDLRTLFNQNRQEFREAGITSFESLSEIGGNLDKLVDHAFEQKKLGNDDASKQSLRLVYDINDKIEGQAKLASTRTALDAEEKKK